MRNSNYFDQALVSSSALAVLWLMVARHLY